MACNLSYNLKPFRQKKFNFIQSIQSFSLFDLKPTTYLPLQEAQKRQAEMKTPPADNNKRYRGD